MEGNKIDLGWELITLSVVSRMLADPGFAIFISESLSEHGKVEQANFDIETRNQYLYDTGDGGEDNGIQIVITTKPGEPQTIVHFPNEF